jgi:glutaredoxin 3
MNNKETIVYSKVNCPSCVKAKRVLDNLNVPYTLQTLGEDIQPSELMELFEQKGLPAPRTAPQIFLNGDYIGGYEQLVSYIEDTGFNGTGHSLS